MAKTIKTYSLAEMKDKYIGKVGTKQRDVYENELSMDVLGRMIKTTRQERNLTQEQLGQLVGVQKSQISKLESSANSATIDTILKVFNALRAKIYFNVTIDKESIQLLNADQNVVMDESENYVKTNIKSPKFSKRNK
jgi:transcriptional regulator with XRE-family HTH domain